MPTTFTGRTPPSTTFTGRVGPGSFTYYTWDASTFTWDSTALTWDTFGIGTPATAFTGRTIP